MSSTKTSEKMGNRKPREKGKRFTGEIRIIYAAESDAALNVAYRLLAQYFLKEMEDGCERLFTSG